MRIVNGLDDAIESVADTWLKPFRFSNEVIEAAGEPGEGGVQHTVREACDVLFHLWVLLASRGISVDSLRRELERREGVSGLEEKRRRQQGSAS